MKKKGTLCALSLFWITLLTLLLAHAQRATDFSGLSEKNLYKEYERAYRAGDLEQAYEALTLALRKRNAGRSKPKPHKKYTPALEDLRKVLANRTAKAGLMACEKGDLYLCEEILASGRPYGETAQVLELRKRLQAAKDSLQRTFAQAVQQARQAISDVQYERVATRLAELDKLHAYSRYLPNLDAELTNLGAEYFRRLLTEGAQQTSNRHWDQAEKAFLEAGKLHPGFAEPKAGLATVRAGRKADDLGSEAERLLSEQAFDEALRLITEARSTYPQGAFIEPIRKKIQRSWVEFLAPQIPRLAENETSFQENRQASVYLAQIARLDRTNRVLRYRPQVETAFGYASYDLGLNLKGSIPHMASAYTLLLSAQMRLEKGTVPLATLKAAASDFNRKRASQLLISVENLAAAPGSFVDAVFAVSGHTVESLALPDLRVRSLEQYYESPDEDPEFQDLLPDSKSSTCLLRIGISKHLSERWAANVEDIESGFVAGSEMVINPDYGVKEKELVEFRRKIASLKSEEQRRLQEPMYQLMLEQFKKIERTIPKDKITNYTYKKIAYNQQTQVDLLVTLSDLKTKSIIFSDTISFKEEQPAQQLTGVHEKDIHGARNEDPLLPSPEQSLHKAQRSALTTLESKIREILPLFTHRFFKEGERLNRLGRTTEAAEQLLCHWAFFRGHLDPTQDFYTTRLVLRETGFDLKRRGAEFLALVARTAPAVR